MMNLSIVSTMTKQLANTINRNSPTILTALGVAGLVSTVILAIKATPKALNILGEEQRFRYEEEHSAQFTDTPIDIFDSVELTWKCYVPTMLMGAATIGCIIGSNRINLRRNAALASLFSIAETTLREYQAKVAEEIGEKKEEKIRADIVQDKLNANPAEEKTIILTGKGMYLCFDTFSGRYFRSNIEVLQRAENVFNQRLLREGWFCINYFYEEIGLEFIEFGQEMGWIADRGLMELKFTTKMAKDNEPCLVVDYRVLPHHF